MSLNIKTGERDPTPPSRWKKFLNRAFGYVLLAILTTALVKCSAHV